MYIKNCWAIVRMTNKNAYICVINNLNKSPMKYKLLVLDVDGTLVNNQKEITPRTLSTLLPCRRS